LGRILTIDSPCHCQIVVVEWCYMCKKTGETADHLLVHCEYASELWSLLFCLFGVQWVMPSTILDVLASWKGRFSRRGKSVV
jgi:hypothetical protein